MSEQAVGLAERLLALLDQAAVATTYKYALLLALMDASLDQTDVSGSPPDRIDVRRLAEHVLGLYWPHTDPYPETGEVLRQSGTGQAELLSQIRRFRLADPAGRSTLAAARYSSGYERLVATTAWKLAEMPLPRLQRIGNVADQFLYEIGWDETITRRTFESAKLRPHRSSTTGGRSGAHPPGAVTAAADRAVVGISCDCVQPAPKAASMSSCSDEPASTRSGCGSPCSSFKTAAASTPITRSDPQMPMQPSTCEHLHRTPDPQPRSGPLTTSIWPRC